jgi:hypothetical protein
VLKCLVVDGRVAAPSRFALKTTLRTGQAYGIGSGNYVRGGRRYHNNCLPKMPATVTQSFHGTDSRCALVGCTFACFLDVHNKRDAGFGVENRGADDG